MRQGKGKRNKKTRERAGIEENGPSDVPGKEMIVLIRRSRTPSLFSASLFSIFMRWVGERESTENVDLLKGCGLNTSGRSSVIEHQCDEHHISHEPVQV